MSEVEAKAVEKKNSASENTEEAEHDPHYDPIISLPEVEVPTLEEDETVMLSLRAKLYRYDSNEVPPEWKERGTGNVKILCHKLNNTVRVVMRRDKTLKLCANHFITPFMNLKPSSSCERAWVYSVKDFSDATVKSELLAIKFATIENAFKWRDVFEEAKKIVSKYNTRSFVGVSGLGKSDDKNDLNAEEKLIPTNSPKLNDSCEEETKNAVSDKEKDSELSISKQTNAEVSQMLSSMSIKGTEES